MSDCIEFQGCKSKKGYGRIVRMVGGKYKDYPAHRLAYAEVHGPIPDGLHVLHKCDNPPCVNVDHLFLGTNADNVRDREAKGRGKRLKGGDHGNSKLTEAEIPRIRDMLRIGCYQRDIAKWFGVSQTTIWFIKTGRAWKHVA